MALISHQTITNTCIQLVFLVLISQCQAIPIKTSFSLTQCPPQQPICIGPRCRTRSAGYFYPKPYSPQLAAGIVMEYSKASCPSCECHAIPLRSYNEELQPMQTAVRDTILRWHTQLCRSCSYSCRYLLSLSLRSANVTGTVKREMQRRHIDGTENLDKYSSDSLGFPHAIVVGTQKGGTTEFWNRLVEDPLFSRPRKDGGIYGIKELHFLDSCLGVNQPGSSAAADLTSTRTAAMNWCNVTNYLTLLGTGRKYLISMNQQSNRQPLALNKVYMTEASPSYLIFPQLPALTNALFPQTKILAILREPVSRCFSGYHQSIPAYMYTFDIHDGPSPSSSSSSTSTVPFSVAIQPEVKIIRQCEKLYPDPTLRYTDCIWPMFTALSLSASLDESYIGQRQHEFNSKPRRCTAGILRKHSLVIRGLYYYQVKAWIDEFGPDRVHVMLSEEYFHDPPAIVSDALSFITNEKKASKRTYQGGYARNSASRGKTIDAESEQILKPLYAPYNKLLVELLAKHGFPQPKWS